MWTGNNQFTLSGPGSGLNFQMYKKKLNVLMCRNISIK